MRVLVLGGGGREHTLAWKLSRSPIVKEVWCAPGNAGIAREVETVSIAPDTPEGIEEAIQFAKAKKIDLTVVGPEAPLVLGVVDRFEKEKLNIFGPNRQASRLEGSKCFAKDFMDRHSIPTAAFRTFDNPGEARRFVEKTALPVVIKADGLAAGKGVVIARERAQALQAIDTMMLERRFGEAGSKIVVEDFLPGTEMTLIVLTDGETALPLETAQDYKPALNGNQGPNTGGMGSYSPHVPVKDPLIDEILDRIIYPALAGLRIEKIPYCGAIYAGLMLTEEGPQVLEFNVRFGDPEAQAILYRLKSDLAEVIQACLEERLNEVTLEWDNRPSVCVVGASQGYPGPFESGFPIEGLEEAEQEAAASGSELKVFFAGVKGESGAPKGLPLYTSGGRVLGVTALGETLEQARGKAYQALKKIRFTGLSYRDDIGIPYGLPLPVRSH